MSARADSSSSVIPAASLLDHWQGHRRLTRRVIQAFPEPEFSNFSIGSMRPFGALAVEILTIAEPMVRGIATEVWPPVDHSAQLSKQEILRRWDESTEAINDLWRQIPIERFAQTMTAFGQYPGRVYDLLLYAIDNEIHHRGQGYVYLRALGVEPPRFYER